MKCCSQCGAPDNPVVEAVGEESLITHFVRPEIQYLKPGEQGFAEGQTLTLRQLARGWVRRIFQGRPAIEREICMDCLNVNYIRRQLNAEQRKKAQALERDQSGESNFFLLLADTDGNY